VTSVQWTWHLQPSPDWCTPGYSVTFWRLHMNVRNHVAHCNSAVNYLRHFFSVISRWLDWSCLLTDVRLGYFAAFTTPSHLPKAVRLFSNMRVGTVGTCKCFYVIRFPPESICVVVVFVVVFCVYVMEIFSAICDFAVTPASPLPPFLCL
jgi:hypothetical protein